MDMYVECRFCFMCEKRHANYIQVVEFWKPVILRLIGAYTTDEIVIFDEFYKDEFMALLVKWSYLQGWSEKTIPHECFNVCM